MTALTGPPKAYRSAKPAQVRQFGPLRAKEFEVARGHLIRSPGTDERRFRGHAEMSEPFLGHCGIKSSVSPARRPNSRNREHWYADRSSPGLLIVRRSWYAFAA